MKRNHFGLVLGVLGLVLSFPAAADVGAGPVKFYGFALPFVSLGSAAVESSGYVNSSAITAAANPVLAGANKDDVRSTFQVAQSRFGLLVNPSADLEARLEMDFIDFSKSSPTTTALPRLRRAALTWNANSDLKFIFGQDWDLISPLAPFTYDVVGHFFLSGDIAFMRHQLQAIHRAGAWETGVALGLPAANPGNSDNQIELSVLPTFALRETYKGDGWEFGVSGLLTAMRIAKTSPDRMTAGALTVFGDFKSGTFEFRSEAYVGQNTANLGLQGLSFGRSGSDVSEAGFYVTGRSQMGSMGMFGSLGAAAVLNPTAMLPSYAAGVLAGTGPGIESNITAHFGVDHKIAENSVLYAELSYWRTRHHLAAADSATDPNRGAVVLQLGSQVNL